MLNYSSCVYSIMKMEQEDEGEFPAPFLIKKIMNPLLPLDPVCFVGFVTVVQGCVGHLDVLGVLTR